MKFEFRYKSLKSKFSLIPLVCNLVIGCYKKNRENYLKNAFKQKKKKPGLKFNPGLELIGLRTTGTRTFFHVLKGAKQWQCLKPDPKVVFEPLCRNASYIKES